MSSCDDYEKAFIRLVYMLDENVSYAKRTLYRIFYNVICPCPYDIFCRKMKKYNTDSCYLKYNKVKRGWMKRVVLPVPEEVQSETKEDHSIEEFLKTCVVSQVKEVLETMIKEELLTTIKPILVEIIKDEFKNEVAPAVTKLMSDRQSEFEADLLNQLHNHIKSALRDLFKYDDCN